MKPERWKPVVGFEELYEISSHGRIKSFAYGKEKIINGWVDGGYRRVTLSIGEEEFTFKVHRLVGIHFKANPYDKPYINHLDCDGLNNYEDNLEWSTGSENTKHAHDNQRIRRHHGVMSHMSKVLVHLEYGIFSTVAEVAKAEEKSFGQMAAIIRGEYPNKTKWSLL